MRVFLAIEIPQDIKERLAEIQEELKPQLPDVRWEDPKKLHITLVFLGEVGDERISELKEVVRKGVKSIKPFEVGFSEVGFFPKTRPRVVLVEVGEGAEQVVELQRRLAEVLSGAGFDFAKLSKPHVTLGRFKRGQQRLSTLRVDRAFKQCGCQLATLRVAVTGVVIMESKLHPSGAIHTPIARITLEGRGNKGR